MKQGWTWLHGSRKWHYFIIDGNAQGGTSLCGAMLGLNIVNDLEDSNHNSKDNCAECKRRVAKMNTNNKATGN